MNGWMNGRKKGSDKINLRYICIIFTQCTEYRVKGEKIIEKFMYKKEKGRGRKKRPRRTRTRRRV